MAMSIDRPILGLNWKIDSRSLIVLKGRDLTNVNSVVVNYPTSGAPAAIWKSTQIRVKANGRILFAVVKSTALPGGAEHPLDPPGLSDVSVTASDSGSGTSATETVPADIYED